MTKASERPCYRKLKLKQKEWATQGLCNRCGKNPIQEGRKGCIPCNKRAKIYGHSARPQAKLEIFKAYGGCQCVCCGETNPIFLTLDHIAENGAKHREEIFGLTHRNGKGGGTGLQMYTHLKRLGYPPGFQVLCWNCNAGKHLNKGICPHQTFIGAGI